LIGHGPGGRVAGGNDHDQIVGKDEVVEILELDEALVPAMLIESRERLVAPEAEIEHADIRVACGDGGDHMLDRFVVQFDGCDLADRGRVGRDDYVQVLAAPLRRNKSRPYRDVTKYDAGRDPRGVIITAWLVRLRMEELGATILGEHRVFSTVDRRNKWDSLDGSGVRRMAVLAALKDLAT
jgi:hypothetical protein